MPHDTLGAKLAEDLLSFQADDESRFSLVLKKPFPFVLLALASTGGNKAIIMRRQDAEANPSRPITTSIGSGPFRFVPRHTTPASVRRGRATRITVRATSRRTAWPAARW